MLFRRSCLALVLALIVSSLKAADEPLLRDNFSSNAPTARRALRGDWKIADGVARCTQDDALYAKLKNHGPIIFYDVPLTDAKIRFQVKPEKTKTVVFTANGEKGHVFRFILSETGMSVRAFPPGGDAKSISVSQLKWTLKPDEWNKVEVTLRGAIATVQIGDVAPQAFENPSYAQPKINISIGFSFGSLNVKELEVTKL